MRIFLFVVTVLITYPVVGQSTKSYLKNGIFHSTVMSGINEDVPVKIIATPERIEELKNHIVFQRWVEENPGIIKEEGLKPEVAFLKTAVEYASNQAQMKVKNRSSYTPISEGKGELIVRHSTVEVNFPFKAQNGFGNYITSKSNFVIRMVRGRTDAIHNFN